MARLSTVPPRSEIPTRLQAVLLWLMALIAVVVTGFGVGAVAAILAVRAGLTPDRALALISDPHSSPLVTSSTWIASSIVVNELAVAVTLFIWVMRKRPHWGHVFPLGQPTLRTVFAGLLIVFGFGPLAEFCGEVALRFLPRDVNAERLVVAVARNATSEGLVLVLVAAAILPALVEEMMFRGLITRAFEKRSHAEMVLIPSLMFGLFHLEPTQIAGTIVLGVAFALARLYSGSLVPPMVAHAAYNSMVILDVRFASRVGDHVLHFGRVGAGLGVAALGTLLMVSSPGNLLPTLRHRS
ncbi:MAG TPA: CPBP family intramembrane glutamic endopeptidase [Polyangiaceae bacterium]|jgi:membrane protease YdiL (CAAX protease family)